MVLETVAKIFLVIWSDVQIPRQVTPEANEYTYNRWRYVLREFKMNKVIGIDNKCRNFINGVFERGLKACRLKNRVYQEKFGEYAGSAKKLHKSSMGKTPFE